MDISIIHNEGSTFIYTVRSEQTPRMYKMLVRPHMLGTVNADCSNIHATEANLKQIRNVLFAYHRTDGSEVLPDLI